MTTITKAAVKKLFPPRPAWTKKGDHGRVLVIGGNKTYSGAPTLAGMAALRTGADLVGIVAPRRAADIAAGFSPSLITHPQRGDFFNSWHLKETLFLAKRADALVIGNGMGRRQETERFLNAFLQSTTVPAVIDADALYLIKQPQPHHILTPHAHEFSVLTGDHPPTILSKRQGLVKRAAKKFGCTILLKGHVDIISNGTQVILNKTGNPLMSKAGTGDVLAGIVGALLARGTPPLTAAAAGAWINGTAGEHAAKVYGETMLAEHLLSTLQEVIA